MLLKGELLARLSIMIAMGIASVAFTVPTAGAGEIESEIMLIEDCRPIDPEGLRLTYLTTAVGDRWAIEYHTETEVWRDLEDEHILIDEELDHLRHYQMKVTYDERIRDPETQPKGLPQGYGGSIFAEATDWEEIK